MDWGVQLVSGGPFSGLPDYEPSLLSSLDGHRVTLVAMIETRDNAGNGHLCRGLVTGQRFRLKATVPCGTSKVSILAGQVTHLRGPVVTVDEKARLLCHKEKHVGHLFKLIETCSGLGALGLGAQYAGWETQVHNDLMESFSNHLKSFSKVEVVHGDICKLATVAALHDAAPFAASLAFGFSCQPFSCLGDRKEGMDERSRSLPFGLYAAHLLQVDLVITECVPEACQSPFVLRCMQQYMQVTRSDRSESLLELADLWPSFRRRWWSVLLKSHMGKVTIPPFPKLSMPPTVASLFPGYMPMTEQELQQLTLTTDERLSFERYGKGLAGHILNMHAPLPTALHSWANQLLDCACGCRGPLSSKRLEAQGLFGVLAHLQGFPPDANVRHLSAREMALLTGFPKSYGWTDHQRLLTAGVGQLASPLHSAWIFAAILNHLIDHGFCPGPSIPPKQILGCVAADLFKLRDEWFGTNSTATMELVQEQLEAFLEPPGVDRSPQELLDTLTDSQEHDLQHNASNAEFQAPRIASCVQEKPNVEEPFQAVVSACPTAPESSIVSHVIPVDDRSPVAGRIHEDPFHTGHMPESHVSSNAATLAFASAQHPPNALVPITSVGPLGPHSKEVSNSQRTGRENREEKQSGETQNQPASRPQEPDKTVFKQTAVQAPELPPMGPGNPPAPAITPVEPPAQQGVPLSAPVAAQVDAPFWESSTGALAAFSTGHAQTVVQTGSSPQTGPQCQVSVRKRQLPPQVCQHPHELLEVGVMVYDVDTHQMCLHRCSPDATFQEWLQASRDMSISQAHFVDMFGHAIDPNANLVALKWIITCDTPLPFVTMDLRTRPDLLRRLPRVESVLLQGAAVASDEMKFYLQAIASSGLAKMKPPFILDDLLDLHVDAQSWITDSSAQDHSSSLRSLANQWIQGERPCEATVTAVWMNQHWIPVWMVPSSTALVVHTTHEGLRAWELMFPWWSDIITLHDEIPSMFTRDCGFRAFAWLVHQCTHSPAAALQYDEALAWRNLFWQHLLGTDQSAGLFVLGGQSELETAIQALLRSHGVFADRLPDRTAILLRSFSHQALANVFQAIRPWQLLKQMASGHQPPIRLVQEDELQATIKARTKGNQSVQAKQKKPSAPVAPQYVMPEDILIPPGIFCLATGEPVQQISPQQLGQSSQGVVAFTERDVQPFLQHAPTTTSGLGFLILAPYTEATAQQGQVLRFPVQSKVTSEPMLISAVLVQRGSIPVVRNVPAKPHAVEQVETQTVKCFLYRDQCPEMWDSIISKPVKQIIGMVEALQICKAPSCACGKYHPADQQAETPILDVWQRDFLSINFQKTRPSDAQIYSVALRVTHQVYKQLFQCSGANGVYFEPRSDDGPGFMTVWIPKQPLADIRALQAMQTAEVSLVRVSFRYGFKVSASSAEQVHASINPNDPFLAGPSRQVYRVGPFPWGTTKKAIQALFHQWGWPAKAIHSVSKAKDSSGLMWLVHANGPPSSLVFQLQHGDVVVHQDSPVPKEVWKAPQAQASIKEFRDKQPVEEFDPWADAAKKLPRSDTVSQAQLATIEANVEHRVVQKIQAQQETDVAMNPSLEPRVQQLEQQLANLQARSGVIETKVDYLHQQVEQQATKFETALDSKLSEQMLRIEALMTKRARSHE